MATFELPLSGNVNQAIWTSFLSPMNNQYGLINVSLGESSDPDVEKEVLAKVGSYGRQLGRIGDALIVLLRHVRPKEPLSRKEQRAIDELRSMLNAIADLKEEHQRAALRPASKGLV